MFTKFLSVVQVIGQIEKDSFKFEWLFDCKTRMQDKI